MESNPEDKSWSVEERLLASGNQLFLGQIHDQDFFAVRLVPGGECPLPFKPRTFSALIHARRNVSDETIREIATRLLEHGLAYALCIGEHGERVSTLFDELIDEGGFSQEDRTVYSSASHEESIDEAMEYFVLPSGLSDTGLIISIGSDSDYGDTQAAFDNLLGAAGIFEEDEEETPQLLVGDPFLQLDAILC